MITSTPQPTHSHVFRVEVRDCDNAVVALYTAQAKSSSGCVCDAITQLEDRGFSDSALTIRVKRAS